MKDEIIEELWAIKDQIAKECGYDIRVLFERLKEAQKKSKRPVVSRRHLRNKVTMAH